MHSFKRTLLKILVFLFAIMLVTVAITEPYFQSELYHYQDGAVRDRYAGRFDTLISGSSHAYRGLIPAVLDQHLGTTSYNLSASLMTMHGRYEMLKKELDRNPVKFVILDISYNALTRSRAIEGPEGDIYQLARYRNPFERAAYFFKYTPIDDYGRMYYDSLNRGLRALPALLRGEGQVGSSDKYETMGCQPADKSRIPKLEDGKYHTLKLDEALDPQSVHYMEKMIDLCKSRDIPVLVVAIPISERIILQHSNLDKVMGDCKAFCQEHDVPMLDFNLHHERPELFNDEESFYDAFHVSKYGAQAFTDLLSETILKMQAGEDVSDLFYDSYSELEQVFLSR